MKTGSNLAQTPDIYLKPRLLLSILVAALVIGQARRLSAQTFRTLHSFTATRLDSGLNADWPYINSDGAAPNGGLTASGSTLYGTTRAGGTGAVGTVFAVNMDGTGFTTLYSFSVRTEPYSELALSGNTLYGTTTSGGGSDLGTVFALNVDGTGFATLYNFTVYDQNGANGDGFRPEAPLILSSGTLYGTAYLGGSSGNGTVFSLNTDGTGFTTLYNFAGPWAMYYFTSNTDGALPDVQLILSGNALYGMTETGGSSGNGTVFAVNTDGTGFQVLHDFTATSYGGTNSDGANVQADAGPAIWSANVRLVLSGNNLYGTTEFGGPSEGGTLFKLNTDGTGFTVLHSFTYVDGGRPGALVLSGSTLYGTTGYRGYGDTVPGTVFAVNTDGSGFTVLHKFTAPVGNGANFPPNGPFNSDGAGPNSLMLAGNALYGTTFAGGSTGSGTVFSISFSPQLSIIPSGSNVILSWPTNYAGFDYSGYTLQSTTNLGASAIWTTVSPGTVVVNGQNTVTNPISGAQQFYRLSQ